MEKPWDLHERTMLFAVNVLRFCRTLPHTDEVAEIAAIEEGDEVMFWLELLVDSGIARSADVQPLREEANELVAIFTSSRTTAMERRAKKRKRAPKPREVRREYVHRV
jgi:hypothetical protein